MSTLRSLFYVLRNGMEARLSPYADRHPFSSFSFSPFLFSRKQIVVSPARSKKEEERKILRICVRWSSGSGEGHLEGERRRLLHEKNVIKSWSEGSLVHVGTWYKKGLFTVEKRKDPFYRDQHVCAPMPEKMRYQVLCSKKILLFFVQKSMFCVFSRILFCYTVLYLS